MTKTIAFHLGPVVATPGALEALVRNNSNGIEYLRRHASGDWGNLDDDDKEANNQALENGSRIAYSHNLILSMVPKHFVTHALRTLPACGSRIGVYRCVFMRFRVACEEFLDVTDGLRRQQRIRAHITDFSGNILENEDITAAFYRVYDGPVLILARTSLNAAFHWCAPLLNGVAHFDGFGSYTVMIIAISSDVVQTTCTYRPSAVFPQTRQHGPRLWLG